MKILQINASIRGADANSTQLANSLVRVLKANHPQATLKVRDLGQDPHPAIDADALAALFTEQAQRTPEQQARVAMDDVLIEEVKEADTLVLAVPMYNFGIPAQLKSWFDAIARAQVTFRYTDNGPEGLLKNKKVYVTLARGGIYRDTPNDSQVPYLKTMLGFLGMTDIEWIYAEGLAMGAQAAEASMKQAQEQIAALIANT